MGGGRHESSLIDLFHVLWHFCLCTDSGNIMLDMLQCHADMQQVIAVLHLIMCIGKWHKLYDQSSSIFTYPIYKIFRIVKDPTESRVPGSSLEPGHFFQDYLTEEFKLCSMLWKDSAPSSHFHKIQC